MKWKYATFFSRISVTKYLFLLFYGHIFAFHIHAHVRVQKTRLVTVWLLVDKYSNTAQQQARIFSSMYMKL